MDLGERLIEAMESHDLFTINLFVIKIPISDTIVSMWVIMAVMIILAIIFTRKLNLVPSKKQNVIETIVEMINNMVKDAIGAHHWKAFAPYLGTIFLFLILQILFQYSTLFLENISSSGLQQEI